jgi:hypothetical protein
VGGMFGRAGLRHKRPMPHLASGRLAPPSPAPKA